MVRIKEFLADPTGPDTGAEYISLVNDGDEAILLTGWKLQDKSGKTFNLSEYTLPAGKEMRLFSSATKITLNNSDETVLLFDATGALADELVLSGKAITGQATMKLDKFTAEVRSKFFDDLAGSSLSNLQPPTSNPFIFWFITSVVLALAAMLAMRTIKDNEPDNKNSQPGWNG